MNNINIAILCFSLLLSGISSSILNSFFPMETLSKGISISESGFIIGIKFFANVLSSFMVGSIMGVFLSAKNLLTLGLLFIFVSNTLFSFLFFISDPTLYLIISVTLRLVLAMGETAVIISGYSLAGRQGGEEHQGIVTALADSCYGIGLMLGPAVGGELHEVGGFMLPFLVVGGGAVVQAVVVVLGMGEDVYQQLSDRSQEETYIKVTWKNVLSAPPIFLSATALLVGGSAWSWYSTTLEGHLFYKYGLNSAQTGLVFLTTALTYSLASPLVGKMYDKGMGGFKMITTGSSLVMLGLLVMGPFTRLDLLSGLWVTVASMGVQGVGFSLVYIGSLLNMMGELHNCGLPESEQSKGMVSSLWTIAVCLGQAMGTTAGGLAWDWVGFENGLLLEAMLIMISIFLVIGIRTFISSFTETSGEGDNIGLINNNN